MFLGNLISQQKKKQGSKAVSTHSGMAVGVETL